MKRSKQMLDDSSPISLAKQRPIVAKVVQRMAWVDAWEQQLAASRATAAIFLSVLVTELTAGA